MHDPSKGAKEIAKGYPRGSKELVGPFVSTFGPDEAFKWFTDKGVNLKTEDDGRVFPTTDKSQTIIDALENSAKKLNVDVRTRSRVISVKRLEKVDDIDNKRFSIEYSTSSSSDTDNVDNQDDDNNSNNMSNTINCDSIIFATGSSRQGYKILEGLGHSIVSPLPSLFSFKISDKNLTELSGISVPDSKIELQVSKEFMKGPHKALVRPNTIPLLKQKGPLLITHQGLSGPAILRLSAFAARVMAAMNYKFDIKVCWLGNGSKKGISSDASYTVSDQELIDHLSSEKNRHPLRMIGRGFPAMPLPEEREWWDDGSYDQFLENDNEEGETKPNCMTLTRRLWLYLLSAADIDNTLRWSNVQHKDILRLTKVILESKYSVTGRGEYRDEFVTCGGVPLSELNMSTMQSKLVDGLYLCGEILDVDGVTGGYNFQSAWTSGFVAGSSAGNDILESN